MKIAIVTGASKGIGRAIAVRLAKDGMHVVLAARDKGQLDGSVYEIQSAGGAASAIAVDLREPDAAAAVVDFAARISGGLDLIVSNAGATKRGEFEDLSDADFQDGFALKYFGAVRLTRAAWPHLKKSRGGVIFISGIGGRQPGRQFTIGGSVNAALLSFTKAIAETGVRDGVQVNTVNPGTIRTARFEQRIDADAKASGRTKESILESFVADQRIRRIGEPEDIANLVAFLASPEGSLMHGALIDMDGGATKGF